MAIIISRKMRLRFACGHSKTVEIVGEKGTIAHKARCWEERECPDCFDKETERLKQEYYKEIENEFKKEN